MPGEIIFVADVHLHPRFPWIEEKFRKFLKEIKNCTDEIYLLGDIFDFGFKFQKGVHPYYEELVEYFKKLKKELKLYFLLGNHDFWVKNYLLKKGMRVLQNPSRIFLFGKKILLSHGTVEKNLSLSLSNKILSNPMAINIYSLFPPTLGTDVAYIITKLKQSLLKREKRKVMYRIPRGYDIIITGHRHIPFIKKVDNTILANPGSFKYTSTYISFNKTRGIELKKFD